MSNANTHTLYLKDDFIEIKGVENVVTFNENEIVLTLTHSTLILTGSGLDLANFSVDNKYATIKGSVSNIRYKKSAPKVSIIKRLTK